MDFNDVLSKVIETHRQKTIAKGFIVGDLIAIAITGISIVGVSVVAAEVVILVALHYKTAGGI